MSVESLLVIEVQACTGIFSISQTNGEQFQLSDRINNRQENPQRLTDSTFVKCSKNRPKAYTLEETMHNIDTVFSKIGIMTIMGMDYRK